MLMGPLPHYARAVRGLAIPNMSVLPGEHHARSTRAHPPGTSYVRLLRFKAATMPILLGTVQHGSRHWTGGVIPIEKALRLAEKFACKYGTDARAGKRTWDKRQRLTWGSSMNSCSTGRTDSCVTSSGIPDGANLSDSGFRSLRLTPKPAFLHRSPASSFDPACRSLTVAPFHGSPGGTVGEFLLPHQPPAGVADPGAAEGATVDFLRMQRQIFSYRLGKFFGRVAGHGDAPVFGHPAMGRLGPVVFATAMYASMVARHSEGMKEDVVGVDDDGAGVAIAVAYCARSGQ